MPNLKADYQMGGFWGDRIEWFSDNWDEIDLNKDTVKVMGWKPIRPKVGQTLLAEFQKSWILFEFVNVELMENPSDMFFADVKAIDQEAKNAQTLD